MTGTPSEPAPTSAAPPVRRHTARRPTLVAVVVILAVTAAAAVLVAEQVRDASRRALAGEAAVTAAVVQRELAAGRGVDDLDPLLEPLRASLVDIDGTAHAGAAIHPDALTALPAVVIVQADGDTALDESPGVLHAGTLVARTLDDEVLLLRYAWDTSDREGAILRAQGLVVLTALLVAGAVAFAAAPTLRGLRRGLDERSRTLQTLLERERATVERLNEVDAMKDSFLTAISHELRTPLTIITGFAQLLRDRAGTLDPARVEQLADGLLGKTRRLDELLGDLLDIDRLARGVLEPTRHPADVTALLGTAVERMQIESHPVALPDDTVRGEVDPAHVERIVENLVRNAVKYTPAGTSIELMLWRDGDELELVVRDHGPGIPDDRKDEVFEALTRVLDDDPNPGLGAGLALVARLAELHGGTAWATDTPGGGLEVHVRLEG